MSLFLVVLTLLFFIVLDIVKSSKRKTIAQTAKSKDLGQAQAIADRFYHPGHSWVMVSSPEEVTVGVDDFAQKLIGRLSAINLPLPGSRVQQGQSYLTLKRGEKALTQVAPVSGVITGVNGSVLNDPTIVNASPLSKGWIAKIAPSNLVVECRNLLHGVSAAHWEEAVRNQLIQRLLPSIQPVLQDGGMLVDNVSDLVSKEDWQGFVDEFFPNTVTRNDEQTT